MVLGVYMRIVIMIPLLHRPYGNSKVSNIIVIIEWPSPIYDLPRYHLMGFNRFSNASTNLRHPERQAAVAFYLRCEVAELGLRQ